MDTYDTENGVTQAIRVALDHGLGDAFSVRLDSGDIARLSRHVRRQLDDAGCPGAQIFVSGGLDEQDIDSLVRDGAPVDAFGVGTKMGVSADAPSLDSVYKLVAYGNRPVLKLSASKATLPGAKQVFRNLRLGGDIVGLRAERHADRESLLLPVMVAGQRVGEPDTLAAMRARVDAGLASLPERSLRLEHPSKCLCTSRRSSPASMRSARPASTVRQSEAPRPADGVETADDPRIVAGTTDVGLSCALTQPTHPPRWPLARFVPEADC